MLGLFLNLFFTWWLWQIAEDHFEKGSNFIGWMGIALSAANFAAAMAMIFCLPSGQAVV